MERRTMRVLPLFLWAPAAALAVSGGAASQARVARLGTAPAVIDALTAWLRAKGVQRAKACDTQSASVDLLGDGRTQWLACGASRDDILNGNAKDNPSDDSFAVMVWNDPTGAGLHIEPLYAESIGDRFETSNPYTFIGVADLDGSGQMSGALRTRYFQGGRLDVRRVDGQRVSRAIISGWQQSRISVRSMT